GVRWTVSDQGCGFDVERALRRAEEEGACERPSGRGLLLMRAFVDELRWEAGGRRVLLEVRRTKEKRASEGRAWQQSVRVAPLSADGQVDWESAHDALARNISAEGIALLQARLETASRLLITIPTDGGSVSVPASVRRCQPVDGNALEIGCRFEAP